MPGMGFWLKERRLMVRKLTLAPLLLAAALAAGCVTGNFGDPGLSIDPALKGKRIVVLVTATTRTSNGSYEEAKKGEDQDRKARKLRYGIDVPEDFEWAQGRHSWHWFKTVTNLHAFYIPKKWQVEPGDYVEIESGGPDYPAKAIRVVTRWDDPRPGGCYWPRKSANPQGTLSTFTVVCPESDPEAPKYRRAVKESLLSFPVNTKSLPPEDRAKAVDQ